MTLDGSQKFKSEIKAIRIKDAGTRTSQQTRNCPSSLSSVGGYCTPSPKHGPSDGSRITQGAVLPRAEKSTRGFNSECPKPDYGVQEHLTAMSTGAAHSEQIKFRTWAAKNARAVQLHEITERIRL